MFTDNQFMAQTASGLYGFLISNSLRFNDGSSDALNRTPGSAGNRKTMTWSGWVKRSELSGTPRFFGAGDDNYLSFASSGAIEINLRSGGASSNAFVITNKLHRDVSAWYHIVMAIDTTQGTDTNRVKVYVNGVQQTSFSGYTAPSQNNDLNSFNNTVAQYIGRFNSGSYYDGYMADVNFIDGLALDASSFGELKNDIWIPKNTSGLTFGNQGFRLQFEQSGTGTASSSTIGADTSGNTNHLTSVNLASSDVVSDSPTNNFATYNQLAFSANSTYSEGNLKAVVTSGNASPLSFGMTSGKWYAEVRCSGGANTRVGVVNEKGVGADLGGSANSWSKINNSARVFHNGAVTSQGAEWDDGQVAMVAIDVDARKIWYGVEGTWDISGDPAAGNNPSQSSITGDTLFLASASGSGTLTYIFNTGSDGTFGGAETSQGNADGNGIGDFYYAPPSGFLALCTSNLPAPVETVDPAQGGSPQDYFNSTLYTGTGSLLAVTTGFQPDWTWIKSRTTTDQHIVQDSVRGNFILYPDSTQAEGATGGGWVTETSTGFTADANGPINTSGETYVAWNWKAGTSFSNDASATGVGTIDSAGSVNTDVGFSIINYTGTGATSQQTISCGLSWSNKEKLVIIKNRDAATNWLVNSTILSANKVLRLNTSDNESQVNSSGYITYESFGFRTYNGGTGLLNVNNQNFICYCFHEVDGYSKFGSYTGNGSVNGPFIYTGFRPAWIMIKNTDTADDNWYMADTKRNPNNVVKQILEANNVLAEYTTGSNEIDILSNGIKCRNTGGNINVSGEKYIYMAFSEQSFKYANAR